MAKSVRLTEEMEKRIQKAARARGISQSELIREAIDQHCKEILGETLADNLADVAGIVKGGGGRASHTGEAFRSLLKEKRDKK